MHILDCNGVNRDSSEKWINRGKYRDCRLSDYYAIPHMSESRIIRTRLSSLSVENRICDRRSYINGLLLINASGRRANNARQTVVVIEFRRIG